MTITDQEKTGLGNYFIANYPPFSFWKPDYAPDALAALHTPGKPGVPLGLYLHIPFCRKRCKFCYFRVYTDKNAGDISSYLGAITREVEMLAATASAQNRKLDYVYFGGGTPSYLSAGQLRTLMTELKAIMPWDDAREVAFEAEPGTLQRHKLETLKELGVTRLSLGVENFKPEILKYNGRAHLEDEIHRAFAWSRELGFEQVNIDLIAGMVGEDWDNWKECVRKTILLDPDSVTVYQMELPYNTVFSKQLKLVDDAEGAPEFGVADWPTKRAWVEYAFQEFVAAGYEISSAYTVVKSGRNAQFVYRDALWTGADMYGTGVASFGHVNGVHIQNVDTWEAYLAKIEAGELPVGRALPITDRQRLVREFVLQLKTGGVGADYFRRKFGADIHAEFGPAIRRLSDDGWLSATGDGVAVTPKGLLQIDRHLPAFFEDQHVSSRYA